MIFQRIRGHLRFAQIAFFETIAVDDQDSVGLQVSNVYFQRSRIHGYQHIDCVARRVDLVRGEVQLKTAHTGNRPGRGADFRRIVRKRSNIIAIESGGIRELVASDLHAVARVARETDDRLIEHFALGFYWRNFYQCRHSCLGLRTSMNSPCPPGECGSIISIIRMRRCSERMVSKAVCQEPTPRGYHTDMCVAVRESPDKRCVLSRKTRHWKSPLTVSTQIRKRNA